MEILTRSLCRKMATNEQGFAVVWEFEKRPLGTADE
jgi:hypothetical protein